MPAQSVDTQIEQANAELDQGLKTCRSMVNDYRAVLTGEATAYDDDTARAIMAEEWRTQEDSNLWPLPSEGSALSS